MKNALDMLAELEATDAKAQRSTKELIEALKCVVQTFEGIAWRPESLPEAVTWAMPLPWLVVRF